MSAKLGGYFADHGGMFMAATLRRMRRSRVVTEEHQEATYRKDEEGVTHFAGYEIRTKKISCAISSGDVHRLSVVRR